MIAAPYILGFADGTTAQWVLQILGLVAIGGSLMTDHELGAMRVIPMPVHLGVDIASGALLALSPWLFGFADRVFWPHLIVGLWEIGAGLMPAPCPRTRRGWRPGVPRHPGAAASRGEIGMTKPGPPSGRRQQRRQCRPESDAPGGRRLPPVLWESGGHLAVHGLAAGVRARSAGRDPARAEADR